MIRTPARGVARLAVALAAGLVLAAPAVASEGPVGPPTGPPPGPPLANPLAPPTFTPPSVAPGTPPKGTKRPARPRVVKARVTPRRVGTGRSSRLRLSVSGTARVNAGRLMTLTFDLAEPGPVKFELLRHAQTFAPLDADSVLQASSYDRSLVVSR